MNDCRPWTQKSAPGILYGQAEDVRSMLLFATGFKWPRAGKKDKAAALRCLWRIIVKEASGKSFDTPLTGGRWAYWHLGICRTGGRMAHGGGRRRVYGRRVYGGGTGARAAQVHGRTRARAHRRTGGTYTAVGIQARE